jgi:WD40 repeat protein/uncharacterized caspase-like protein
MRESYARTKLLWRATVCLLAWLTSAGAANGQAAGGGGVKHYDDPRVVRWSADFLDGKREEVLRAVEADLLSPAPHPFSPHIWFEVRRQLTGKEPAAGDVSDARLRDALGILPEVARLYDADEYRELLKRFPPAAVKQVRDPWVLQMLFTAALNERRFDESFEYAARLGRVYPDHFFVGVLIAYNFLGHERMRPKVAGLFGKGRELGQTGTGRLIQRALENMEAGVDEEDELKLCEAWLAEFPRDPVALMNKGYALARLNQRDEAIAAYLEAAATYPFNATGFKEAASALISQSKEAKAEALIKRWSAIRNPDAAAAADEAESLWAEALIDANHRDKALTLLSAAISRRPENPDLLFLRSSAWVGSNEPKATARMVEDAKKAVSLMPRLNESFPDLLRYLATHDEYAAARRLFADAEKRYAQKSVDFWMAGLDIWDDVISAGGAARVPAETWRILRQGQKEYPESAELMLYEALFLNLSGRKVEGLRRLKESFTISPPDPGAIELLRRLQSGLTVEESEEEMRALLRRYPTAKGFERYIRKLELYVSTGHASLVSALTFSPDGRVLAGGNHDGAIKLWNAATGQELNTLTHAKEYNTVNTVAFSRDGRLLASAGNDNNIKVWDVASGKERVTLYGHSGEVKSVAFSPDGRTLASASKDKTVKLWSLSTGEALKTIKQGREVLSVAFSPDGKVLAYCDAVSTKLLDAATWNELREIEFFGVSLAFSPDGRALAGVGATVEEDGSIYYTTELIDATTGRELRTFGARSKEPSRSVAFSRDGATLASAEKTISLWEVSSGRELRRLGGHEPDVTALTFAPDGRTLVSAGYDWAVKVWEVASGTLLKTLNNRQSDSEVTFSLDGKMLASRSADNTVRLWDLANGLAPKVLSGHTGSISSIAISPDNKRVAAGSDDKTLQTWDAVTGKQLIRVRNFVGRVNSLGFSPDGRYLLVTAYGEAKAGERSDATYVLDAATGKGLWRYGGGPLKGAFSSDGRLLATYGYYQQVDVWDTSTWKKVANLPGHMKGVNSVRFSADGKLLQTLSNGNNITKVWDVAAGREVTSAKNEWPEAWAGPREGALANGVRIGAETRANGITLVEEKTRRAVATLVALDGGDWVVTDPEGRFDASRGAEEQMHYTYGLEVINLEQLREMYYDPGLLPKLLGYGREPLRPIVPLKEIRPHPEVVAQSLDPTATRLTVTLRSLGGGIGETRVLVNDKLIVADARDARLRANPNLPAGATVTLTVDLRGASVLKGQQNRVTVITSNYLKEIGKGNIQSRGAELVYVDPGRAEQELPSLYAVVGGVSDYEGELIDLRFAAKDAEDFSHALELGARRLFCPKENPDCLDKVRIRTLTTARQKPEEQPTKENFKRAFAEVAREAKPTDLFVIYLAGHGVTLGNGTDTYFFLTKEARSASGADVEKVFKTAAISNAELTNWLTLNQQDPDDIFVKSQRQVLILDTCKAGDFARGGDWKSDRDLSGDQIRAMDFLKGSTGTFVLMGSAPNQPSYETTKFNQGLLTYALLEGMKGPALQSANGNVDVRLLLNYAERRVPELAEAMRLEQRPVIKQPSGNNFVIGLMTDEERAQIKLETLKPLLSRPLLTDPQMDNDDDLKLIDGLRKRLDAESSYEVTRRSGRGVPVFVYVDDASFPGAMRLTGTYTVEGGKVRVKSFLRRDGVTVVALPEILTTREQVLDELLKSLRTELSKITPN